MATTSSYLSLEDFYRLYSGVKIHSAGSPTAGERTAIPLPELFAEVDKLL